jgi:uncharacterized YccA/Bax inhibitor family protein
MALIRSSNPTFRNAVFTRVVPGAGAMTLGGTIAKSFILLVLTLASTVYTWNRVSAGAAGSIGPLFLAGVFGGLAVGFITIVRPNIAPWTAPLYAVLEGLALGVLSSLYNAVYKGLIQEAIALTLIVFLAVLVLYGMRVIRVTGRVRATIVNATCAVFAYYLLDLVIWVIDGARMPLMVSSRTASLVFSLFVAALAAANLVLDFDVIEEGIKKGAPKYLEWYAGFSLLVTLIWIYLELLRLLRKVRNR